jgi:hypothetical protein
MAEIIIKFYYEILYSFEILIKRNKFLFILIIILIHLGGALIFSFREISF